MLEAGCAHQPLGLLILSPPPQILRCIGLGCDDPAVLCPSSPRTGLVGLSSVCWRQPPHFGPAFCSGKRYGVSLGEGSVCKRVLAQAISQGTLAQPVCHSSPSTHGSSACRLAGEKLRPEKKTPSGAKRRSKERNKAWNAYACQFRSGICMKRNKFKGK